MRAWALGFLSILLSGLVMAEQPEVTESIRWIENHAPDCTLDDGYVCTDVTEDDFLSRRPGRITIPGPYLAAWSVCYADFQSIPDLSAEQKRLRHYRISFSESKDAYIVLFSALLLPRINADGEPDGILSVSYGRSTKYWVDKKTGKISKRLFQK